LLKRLPRYKIKLTNLFLGGIMMKRIIEFLKHTMQSFNHSMDQYGEARIVFYESMSALSERKVISFNKAYTKKHGAVL
jgi:hypothetical protein